MPTDTEFDYSNLCLSLDEIINKLDIEIKMSKLQRANYDKYMKQIEQLSNTIYNIDVIVQTLTPVLKDIINYEADRKRQTLNSVNQAIAKASEIIPDAMDNVYFEIKGEDAWLQTKDGLLTRLAEGSGFKSILSIFLREVLLSINGAYLQTLILDEPFAKVSVEHSATLSLFINAMSQRLQVISIEQKPEIYTNANYINYYFEKLGDYTRITKENHENVQSS